MKFRMAALLMLGSATSAGWTQAAGQSTSADTTIVERRGDLEFSLTVSPIPRVVGPIVTLTVSVRNAGDSAVSLYVDPCNPTVRGLPPTQNPYHGFAVCAEAPHTISLAPGEAWSRNNGESLDIPPGRYLLRSLITLRPEVWLGLDFTLAELLRSGCRYGWDRRADARLEYLQEMVSSSDSDHAGTRRDLRLPRMQLHEVFLADRPKDCERAVAAINRVRREPDVLREVWLFDLGKHGYAVDDPKLDVGFADKVLYFFDPDFKYLTTYSGF
jgi:hypothetical protein